MIEVRALPQRAGVDHERALAAACVAVARALREPARETWGTWQTVERYVEGDAAATVQPHATHPPLVRVTGGAGRSPDLVRTILGTVAHELAAALELEPGNVLVTWDEVARGHLASS